MMDPKVGPTSWMEWAEAIGVAAACAVLYYGWITRWLGRDGTRWKR